jgi:AAA+ ATPase superfamily predicted ATPase
VVDFVGRRRELAVLERELGTVREAIGSARPGRCLIIRGRRRIGKSTLVEEFVQRAGAPHIFYTAEIGFASPACRATAGGPGERRRPR